jgi:xanthine/CO dehydrogenase XdhC/CoxF family maturation factor
LEEDLLDRARQVAVTGIPALAVYDTISENDLVWGVGLGCHGVVRVLLEPLSGNAAWLSHAGLALDGGPPCKIQVVWESAAGRRLGTDLVDPSGAGTTAGETAPFAGIFRQTLSSPPLLLVCGAGDDAQPLVRLGAELGWRVTVADPRPGCATALRFPAAREVVSGPVAQLVEAIDPGPGAFVVIMTHHYLHDLPLLRTLLPRPLAYLGLLGPRKRATRLLETLEAEGLVITEAMRGRLFAPVGLDLGSEGPEEIALSVIAEMQAKRTGRNGLALRERRGPIHNDRA